MFAINKTKTLIIGLLLVLPIVLLRFFTSLYPMIITFQYSFLNYNLIKGTKVFFAFGNFVNLFRDTNVIGSLEFTFIFTIGSVVLQVIMGILFALMLNVEYRGQRFIRSIALIPWAIPMVVAGIAASWAFQEEYGLVNDILFRVFHIRPLWMVFPFGARAAVILTNVWKGTPFVAIIVLAGLQHIEAEVYESVRIDGASAWIIFWKIILPAIVGVIGVISIFMTLWNISSFDLVYAMTKGGPGVSTSLLSYRVYQEAFSTMNYGYASAIAVVMFFMIAIFAAIAFRMQKRIMS
ncbi:MAG: sugar ABC transporter permease [Spirochaetota bacterium]